MPWRYVAVVGVAVLAIAVLSVPQFSVFGLQVGSDDTPLGLSLGLDLQGGSHLVYRIIPVLGQTLTQDDADGLVSTINTRVNEFGVSESSVQLVGGGDSSTPDRILVQIPAQAVAPSIQLRFENQPYDSLNPDRPQRLQDITDPNSEAVIERFREDITAVGTEIERIIKDDLGYTDVVMDISQEPFEGAGNTGSFITNYTLYTYRFENLLSTDKDAEGNLIRESDADLIYRELQDRFLTAVDFSFVVPDISSDVITSAQDTIDDAFIPLPSDPQLIPGGTDTTASDVRAPTYDEVGVAFETAGYPDVDLMIISEAIASYRAILGDVAESGLDADGNSVADGFDSILSELVKIGTVSEFSQRGDFNYVPTGGIEEAKRLIGSTALLEFRERTCAPPLPRPDTLPDAVSNADWNTLRCLDPAYYTELDTGLNADDLDDAFYEFREDSGHVVNIVFNQEGAQTFFDITNRISGGEGRIAIYLDGRELVAPGASRPIPDGRAFIHGSFTQEEARTIGIQLRAGALPASLELIQERNVDATLGADSLRSSIIAGSIGLGLLILFLIAYYKVQGLISAFTLGFYVLVLVALFKLVPVTLTLSGAAAVILSFGFAVDANILIAERIKEELRTGRSLFASINTGFSRAWPSIRDGNLSTLIIAVVLYWFGDRFGTSIMQGFALTLGIGVLLSMITAFLVNRVIMRAIAALPPFQNSQLFLPVVAPAEAGADQVSDSLKRIPERQEGNNDAV